jgi:hypothetical protein
MSPLQTLALENGGGDGDGPLGGDGAGVDGGMALGHRRSHMKAPPPFPQIHHDGAASHPSHPASLPQGPGVDPDPAGVADPRPDNPQELSGLSVETLIGSLSWFRPDTRG